MFSRGTPGLVGEGGAQAGLGSVHAYCAPALCPPERSFHAAFSPATSLWSSALYFHRIWGTPWAARVSQCHLGGQCRGCLCVWSPLHPEVPGMRILLRTQEGLRSSGDLLRPKTSWPLPARSRSHLQPPKPRSRASGRRPLADSRGRHPHIALHGRTVPVSHSLIRE